MVKSKFDIDHVAKLSKLTLSEDEKKTFGPQLSEVLDYFNKLQEVDTSDVEPTFHVGSDTNRFQEQKLEADTLSQKDALKNAPVTKDGYIGTKGVL